MMRIIIMAIFMKVIEMLKVMMMLIMNDADDLIDDVVDANDIFITLVVVDNNNRSDNGYSIGIVLV
jgi:hypothetical protein